MDNIKGWWNLFFGNHNQTTLPQPAKQKTLEDYGWVKGADNVYRKSQDTLGQSMVASSPSDLQQVIDKGMQKYNPHAPMATGSAVLADALSQLNPNIDPRIILAYFLKESSGGVTNKGQFNYGNVMPGGRAVNYPDLKTALLGGWNPLENTQSQGFINLINNDPAYATFRQTGQPADLLQKTTPPGAQYGNADLPSQVSTLTDLMKFFQ